jgi:hypothetical protein
MNLLPKIHVIAILFICWQMSVNAASQSQDNPDVARILFLPIVCEGNCERITWLNDSVPDAMAQSLAKEFEFVRILGPNRYEIEGRSAYAGYPLDDQVRQLGYETNANAIIYGVYRQDIASKFVKIQLKILITANETNINAEPVEVPLNGEMFSHFDKFASVLKLALINRSGEIGGSNNKRKLIFGSDDKVALVSMVPDSGGDDSNSEHMARSNEWTKRTAAHLVQKYRANVVVGQASINSGKSIENPWQQLKNDSDAEVLSKLIVFLIWEDNASACPTRYEVHQKGLQGPVVLGEFPAGEHINCYETFGTLIWSRLQSQSIPVTGSLVGFRGKELTIFVEGQEPLRLTQNGLFNLSAKFMFGEHYAIRLTNVSNDTPQLCLPSMNVVSVTKIEPIRIEIRCQVRTVFLDGVASGIAPDYSPVVVEGGNGSTYPIAVNGPFRLPDRFEEGSTIRFRTKTKPPGAVSICDVSPETILVSYPNSPRLELNCRPRFGHQIYGAFGFTKPFQLSPEPEAIVYSGNFPYRNIGMGYGFNVGYLNRGLAPYNLITGLEYSMAFSSGEADIISQQNVVESRVRMKLNTYEFKVLAGYPIPVSKELHLIPLVGVGIGRGVAWWPDDGISFYRSWSFLVAVGSMIIYDLDSRYSIIASVQVSTFFIKENIYVENRILFGGMAKL